MISVAIPASLGPAYHQAEQATSAVDASLVAVPEIRLPVDARGLALGILAALASVLALWWAQAFLVPLLLGIIISYTLNPLVAWLEHIKIPRVIGTLIVMSSVLGALALGTYSMRGQMQTMIEQLPEAATVCVCAHAGKPRQQHTENANRGGSGRKSDGSGNRWCRYHASASYPCRRRSAAIQARQSDVVEFDGRHRSDGSGSDGRLPGFFPADRWRHIQAKAGPAYGAVAVEKKNHRQHSRRH
jgi:hypothetical protein